MSLPPVPQSPETRQILRTSVLIGGATFLSRILGLARDIVLARLFGAGMAADAFFVAYRIPNMLRELFAEGTMAAAFIPVCSEYVKKRSYQDTKNLVDSSFTMLLFILVVICVVGILGTPLIVYIIAMGFADDPEQQALTIQLTRIMFPYVVFIGLSSLIMGILNTVRSFTAPAFAPVMFNLTIIACAFLVAPQLPNPIYGIAIGVVLGGCTQFLIQLPSLKRVNFSLSLHWNPSHPGVRRIGALTVPTIVGLGVTQANLLLNTILASFLVTGSVTFLFYGMRLVHFPLGLVGIALATAILPSLSALTADGARDELCRHVEFGLRHVFFLMIPATVGLITLRTPIIHLIFEHGEFTADATRGTATAVAFYAIGLWAFGAMRIVVSAFYALQDTRTPVRVAILALFCNIALSLSLVGPLQHGGLAFATSCAAMINVGILLVFLVKKIGPLNWQAIFTSLIRTAVASVIVAVICQWVAVHDLWMQDVSWSIKTMLLGIGVVLSIAGYVGVHLLLRSSELIALRRAFAGNGGT